MNHKGDARIFNNIKWLDYDQDEEDRATHLSVDDATRSPNRHVPYYGPKPMRVDSLQGPRFYTGPKPMVIDSTGGQAVFIT